MKLFFTIFVTVLLAELGDKTQLATLLFSTRNHQSSMTVFFASAAALVTAAAVAVILGKMFGEYVNPKYLAWIAGAGFILIGVWTIFNA